jgi:hypothetical protein
MKKLLIVAIAALAVALLLFKKRHAGINGDGSR